MSFLPLHIYFVSGIDTDAGKSYITGYLARLAAQRGRRVITQKFIQTGGVESNGVSLDINIHRNIMGGGLLEEDKLGVTAPVIFSYPASPHLAAAIDQREIDFAAIEQSTKTLSSKYDLLLIEGAGGLMVPLTQSKTTIDFISDHKYPLIFVTSGKLGSINHTLLSLEACKTRGIEVAMVVYNRYFGLSSDMVIDNDTCDYLRRYIAENHPNCEFIEVADVDV